MFYLQEGEIIKGIENIRHTLESFISMNGKIESKVDAVIHISDIALVNTEWSFNGTGPDGKVVTITGKATDVLRRQSDDNWRILIDNPWGTNLHMHEVLSLLMIDKPSICSVFLYVIEISFESCEKTKFNSKV